MTTLREIVDLTADLIRIPSVHSRKAEIGRCAEFIVEWLSARDIAFDRTSVNGTPVLTVLPNENRADILLMADFDVVEADDDLFTPVEKDGRLYGRGAIDDKYAVALSLILFRDHLERVRRDGGTQSDLPFGLLLTGDEEIGGANGAGPASESIHTDFFIALDGGAPNKIVVKEKGVLRLKLTARGKAAHAARPWLGESAFENLVADYARLKEIFSDDAPDHWHKTMVLSRCEVGDGSTNKLPGFAEAILDIRFTETDDPDAILDSIRNAVAAEVALLIREPLFLGGPSPYRDLLLEYANGAELTREHGSSDARFFSARGVPGVVWGAEGEMSQHTSDEHILLDSLADLHGKMDGFLSAAGGECPNLAGRKART
ncbi:MAG: M20 family metallopeptidase [Desulfococcaceae bacterium]